MGHGFTTSPWLRVIVYRSDRPLGRCQQLKKKYRLAYAKARASTDAKF